jgi:hypothetical protein
LQLICWEIAGGGPPEDRAGSTARSDPFGTSVGVRL